MINIMDIIDMHFKVDDCGDGELQLETWTDGGVNMFFYVDKNNIINEFREYAESFDIDEEIDVLREDRRYRDAFTLKESIADFEAYKNLLDDIAEKLQGNVSKVSTEVLTRHNSYITAIEEVIDHWNNAQTSEQKTRFIKAIGEIGYQIYKQNIKFGI